MVEQNNVYLDSLFNSLANPTRRDMLQRLANSHLSITQLARHYNLSFAAIAKHLAVLERAKLVHKKRQGREQIVHIAPQAMYDASRYLKQYERMWDGRFERLDNSLRRAA